RSVLEQKSAELELSKKVLFTGQQHNPEDWMRAMDVFCLPSYANEGVPQALMQAMFTGLPVISTPVGAITEIIGDGRTGLIVPPQDTRALAENIARLLADRDLARRLGVAARTEAVVRFGYELMTSRMETSFRNTITRRKSA
ncbi:glycosyltransferase family 4 protein, partial [Candidatus Kaiserbacteria bacterium]|nr:glycosyltransferase family 4 protein [Candidatus Kaiserbacteria bacterium]